MSSEDSNFCEFKKMLENWEQDSKEWFKVGKFEETESDEKFRDKSGN
jgi:hypothetical protein